MPQTRFANQKAFARHKADCCYQQVDRHGARLVGCGSLFRSVHVNLDATDETLLPDRLRFCAGTVSLESGRNMAEDADPAVPGRL